MNKIAQRRGIFNELRAKLNMPGSYLEGFFKPELDRVMSALKTLDAQLRAELTGKNIEGAAPSDSASAKDLIKSARTNFNRREYMAGVADLGHFNKKMFDITQKINMFFVDVNKIHNKFLFQGLPDDYQNKLKMLENHMSRKAHAESQYFIKEAGIMDFFYNIGTKRGRSLAAWEKKYPKQVKALRDDGIRLVEEAERLLENTIANMKAMATARATRRPDEYMDIANRIKFDFDKFDGGERGFKAYYSNAVKPWLDLKAQIEAANGSPVATPFTSPEEAVDTVGKQELGGNPVPAVSAPAAPIAVSVPPAQDFSAELNHPAPVVPKAVVNDPALQASQEKQEAPQDFSADLVHPTTGQKLAHQSFYKSLQVMSQEDPRILASYISKYARSIQKTDLETAVKLFGIVKSIKK